MRDSAADCRRDQNNMALGSYYLLACAYVDVTAVAETNEANICLASASTVQVTRPDLVTARRQREQPAGGRAAGVTFQVVDTVQNQRGRQRHPQRPATTRPPTRRRTPATAC